MPSVDFWLDWSLRSNVETLRHALPEIASASGFRVDEVETFTTSPGWAMFALIDPAVSSTPVGSARAQDSDGAAQMFIGPGQDRSEAGLTALNRIAVVLYAGLILRGALAPPLPMESPSPPIQPGR